jgi:predicted permease
MPSRLSGLIGGLRARLGLRPDPDAEMAEEIRLHLEQRIAEFIAQGLSPAQARTAAHQQFGPVEPVKEACRDERRRAPFAESVGRDLRMSVRLLCRKPGFAAGAVLTLALGVGVNVAVFAAVRAVLLDEAPYPESERLVQAWQVLQRAMPQPFYRGDLDALREQVPALASIAGETSRFGIVIRGDDAPETARIGSVTSEFFEVFGLRPAIGRTLGLADAGPDARSAVLSHGIWLSQFGGRADVLGRTLWIDREPWTVVGVMPRGFATTTIGGISSDVWVPLPSGARASLYAFARLAPASTLEEAHAQADAVIRARQQALPQDSYTGGRPVVYDGMGMERLGTSLAAETAPGLMLLQGVAACLLLITCVNLANLLLARGTDRRREFGMRAALGGSRRRLVRQLLTEATLLATIGGALGVGIAAVLVPVLTSTDASILPEGAQVTVWGAEVVVGLLLAWTTVALFATLPAYATATVDPLDLIRGTARHGASRPIRMMRGALITAQMLLAVVMLTGAGLLIRSFANVVSLPLGFDPRGLVVASVEIADRDQDSREDEREFVRKMDEALRASLGALPLAFGSLPQGFTGTLTQPWMFGTGAWDNNAAFTSAVRPMTAGSFEMLGQAIRQGRSFDHTDGPVAPRVAMVNQAFVRRYADGQDVIGQALRTTREVYTIVGVVDDVRMSRMTLAPRDAVYVPLEQDPLNGMSIAVRTSNTAIVERAIRDVIRQLDPDMPLLGVASVDDRLAQGEARRRFYLAMMVVFGGLAGTIAAVGVYGVTAHVTRLRRRELAIRMALGARPVSLKAIVLRQGLWPAALGVAAGIVAAGWLTQLLHANPVFRSQIYQVTPRDPWTFALAAIGLLAVAAFACWLPAGAVDELEPVSALKSE